MSKKHAGQALRVTITITESKMPQWYAFLNAIQSGNVRAEMVRLHLQDPDPRILLKLIGAGSLLQEYIEKPTASEQAIQPGPTANRAEEPKVSSATEDQTRPAQSDAEQKAGLARSLLRRGGEVAW